jgi:hypothetical protein
MDSFTKLAFSIKKKEGTKLLKALGLSGAALAGGGIGLALHNSMLGTEALEQAAALNRARRQWAGAVDGITQEAAEGAAMNNALSLSHGGSQLNSDVSHLTIPPMSMESFGELPKPLTGNAPIEGVTDSESLKKLYVKELMQKAKEDADLTNKMLNAKVIPKAVEPQARIQLTDEAAAKLQAKLKALPENDWAANKARMEADEAKFKFEQERNEVFEKMRRNQQGNAKLNPADFFKLSPENQNKTLKVFRDFSEPIGGKK